MQVYSNEGHSRGLSWSLLTNTLATPLQVYRAKLASTGEEVAVKVQRPAALSIISKVSFLQAW